MKRLKTDFVPNFFLWFTRSGLYQEDHEEHEGSLNKNNPVDPACLAEALAQAGYPV